MNKKSLGFLLALTLLVSACGSQEPVVETKDEFLITTSLYPVYYFTSEIVQDKAKVVNLTPEGTEPHDYEPTPYDLETMQESDLLVVNGNLEPWLEDMEGPLKEKGVSVLVLTKDMDLLEGSHEHEEEHEEEHEGEEDHEEEETKDPHVWLDPILAYEMVEHLMQELSILDPKNTDFYEANALTLKDKLLALDEEFSTGLKSCGQDTFVTSHAAFAYLAKRYGLNQLPIAGLSPEAEPSAAEMSDIVDFVKANDVKVIFFESLVSPALSEAIASEVDAKTLVLNPIEGLTEEEFSAGKNYFTVMEQNLENLNIALECQ